jgi:hypothetical protein
MWNGRPWLLERQFPWAIASAILPTSQSKHSDFVVSGLSVATFTASILFCQYSELSHRVTNTFLLAQHRTCKKSRAARQISSQYRVGTGRLGPGRIPREVTIARRTYGGCICERTYTHGRMDVSSFYDIRSDGSTAKERRGCESLNAKDSMLPINLYSHRRHLVPSDS